MALQAQIIRWCVQKLRMDPRAWGLRGHETAQARRAQIDKNHRDQKLATLYLEQLATSLENESVGSIRQSTKGTIPCSEI